MASIEEALRKTEKEETLKILGRYFNFKKDFIDSITLTGEIYNLFVGAYNAETKEPLKKEIEQRIALTQKIANDFFNAFWDFKDQTEPLKEAITHLREEKILETNKKLQAPFQFSQQLWGNKSIQNEDTLHSKLIQQQNSLQRIISLSDLDFENYKDFFKHDCKLFQYLATRLQDYIIFQSFNEKLQKLKEHSDDLNSITTWLETYNKIREELPKTQIECNTLKTQADNLYKEIGLLKQGLISKGLAKNYSKKKRSNNYQKIFWTTLVLLGLTTIFQFGNISLEELFYPKIELLPNKISEKTQTLSEYALECLKKIPAYLAIVWFILFASRRRNEADRLASDYAHKEVFASSYEAYQEEIKQLKEENPNKKDELTELNIKLLDSMIGVLSDNPAKSLDTKKITDELPAKEIINLASEIIKFKGKNTQ